MELPLRVFYLKLIRPKYMMSSTKTTLIVASLSKIPHDVRSQYLLLHLGLLEIVFNGLFGTGRQETWEYLHLLILDMDMKQL